MTKWSPDAIMGQCPSPNTSRILNNFAVKPMNHVRRLNASLKRLLGSSSKSIALEKGK